MHAVDSLSARLMPFATLMLAALGLLVTYVTSVVHTAEGERTGGSGNPCGSYGSAWRSNFARRETGLRQVDER